MEDACSGGRIQRRISSVEDVPAEEIFSKDCSSLVVVFYQNLDTCEHNLEGFES